MPSNKGTEWSTKGALGIDAIFKQYLSMEQTFIKEDSTTKIKIKIKDKKVFKKILETMNKEFINLVLEGKEMRMPYLSTLCVRKTMPKLTKAFNFKLYNETGKKEFYDNEHSDGFKAKFHWSKWTCPVPGKKVWSLTMTRDNSRALAKEMKKFKGHTKYRQVDGRTVYKY